MEYPQSAYDDRIIAVQCRWLIDTKQYTQMTVNHHSEWKSTLNQITDILRKSVVQIPTLQQVMEMEQIITKGLCEASESNGWTNKCTLL